MKDFFDSLFCLDKEKVRTRLQIAYLVMAVETVLSPDSST